MKFFSTLGRDGWAGLLMAAAFVAGIGCGATGTSSPPLGAAASPRNVPNPSGQQDVLHSFDPITITFDGPIEKPAPVADRIKADGMIHLPLLKEPVKAAGKNRSQLEEEIHALYVPKLFRFLTVRVTAEGRRFTVAGFVRSPNQYPYLGDTTLLKAIAAAGDFTDFSNRKKVRVTRANGQKITVDCLKAQRDSTKDIPIYPDDYIEVPRRYW